MNDASPSRRQYPRIPTKHAVLVNMLGDDVGEELARTRNISVGGCLFTSPSSYRTGSVVQLLIKINMNVVEAVAKVVYSIPKGGGGFDLGAEFIFIKEKDKQRIFALFEEQDQ